MPDTALHEDVERADTATTMTAMRDNWVLWQGLRTAARHLIRLVVPTLVVFLPILALTSAALALVVQEPARLVNGTFELFGTPGPALLGWSAATLLVSVAGQTLVLPATVVLATGLLLGRPVTAASAMRMALRRLPALLTLVLIGGAIFLGIVAAGLGLLLATEQLIGAFLVMAPLALLALPCLLAVPVVLFEGLPAGAAIKRGGGLAVEVGPYHGGYWRCGFALAFGVLVVPGAVQQGVQWAAAGAPLLQKVLLAALGLTVPAFQATVLARLYLHRLAIRSTPAEFGEIAARLPDERAGRARPVTVLAALLVPSLVYGGVLAVNPFGWLELTQTTVTATWTFGGDPVLQPDGRHRPRLGMTDLRSVHAGEDGNMVMLMDSWDGAALLTCRDAACTRTRYAWAEPLGAYGEAPASAARLVGGRLVLTTWNKVKTAKDENQRYRLGLLLCDAGGCAPTGGPITEVGGDALAAVAADPYGGLAVAHVRGLPSYEDGESVHLTRCKDLACTDRTTKEIARLPSRPASDEDRGLLVAMVGDLPVVLRYDERTGSMTLITCPGLSCGKTRVEHLVHGGRFRRLNEPEDRAGAAMQVRSDGRPVIAYRDAADGSIRLLDCRNPACSQFDTAILSAPGLAHLVPALLLDESNRAWIAYQDLDHDHLVLATCEATRCTHTPVAKLEYGAGFGLTMAWDRRGRPVIAWMSSGREHYDLMVTIPLNLPGPG